MYNKVLVIACLVILTHESAVAQKVKVQKAEAQKEEAQKEEEQKFTVLNGIVTMQSSGKTPIEGAEIKIVGDKASVGIITDEHGTFKIKFLDKGPGDRVRISIIKKGLEVVDPDALSVILRKNEADLAIIVMRKEGTGESLAQANYEITLAHINKTAEKKKSAVTGSTEKSEKILSQIEQERQLGLQQAPKVSERLANVNLDETSAIYKEAYKLFQEGKIDQALAVLKDEKLDRNAKDIASEEEKLKKRTDDLSLTRNQAAKNYILKADLSITNLQFEQAEKNYDKAVEMSPSDYKTLLLYSLFLIDQNRLSKAEIILDKAAQVMPETVGKFIPYSFLAGVYIQASRYDKAIVVQRKAIKSIIKIARDTSSLITHNTISLAGSAIIRMAILYEKFNKHDSALFMYQATLDFYQSIKQSTTGFYDDQFRIAEVQQRIGKLTRDTSFYHSSLATYKLYFEYVESIVEKEGKVTAMKYLPAIETAYDSRYRLHMNMQMYKEIIQTSEHTAIFLKENYEPADYLPILAENSLKISLAYNMLGQNKKSLESTQQALTIYKQLAQSNPQRYYPKVATNLWTLAIYQRSQGEYDNSINSYKEAITIYLRLAKDNPGGAYLEKVAMSYDYLGRVYLLEDKTPEALDVFINSLRYYKELGQINPNFFIDDLGRISVVVGELYHKSDQDGEALRHCNNAAKWFESLDKGNTEELLDDEIAEALLKLAKNFEDLKREDDAYRVYKKTKNIYETKLRQNPENDIQYLKPICLASECLILDEKSKSNSDYLVDQLLIKYKGNSAMSKEISIQCGSIAWELLFKRKYQQAEKFAQRGLDIDPSQEWIKTNLAHAYLFQDRVNEAEVIYADLKTKTYNGSPMKDALLKDFQDLQKAGITHASMSQIQKRVAE